MGKTARLQKMIAAYVDQTGETEWDMAKIAAWLERMGWRMPRPRSAVELLEEDLRRAARDARRVDSDGTSYRPYHAVTETLPGGKQLVLWFDLDRASRKRVVKSLGQRREQMVGDAMALVTTADHWNRLHPDEEPIQMELDFEPDVLWKRAAANDQSSAS